MPRLVDCELASPRQSNRGNATPGLVVHGHLHHHTLRFEPVKNSFQVVAHQIQLVLTVLSRVYGDLRWWQGEDQPTTSCIDRLKPENIPKERPVAFNVAAADDHVGAGEQFASAQG